jgi:type IV pilus assembly protein PilP
MTSRATGRAVFALLAGTLAAAGAAAAAGGPLAAVEKAREAADAASRRGAATDAAAVPVLRPPEDPPPAARDAAPVAGAIADVWTDAGDVAGAEAAARTQATARYDPRRHRDPFRPPRLAVDLGAGPRTPLERYEIGQLKLVGVVWNTGASRAMVEDSAGLGYILVPGTPIGSSGGVVRRIEPTRVVIQESVTNFYGEPEPREVVMELPKEDRSP